MAAKQEDFKNESSFDFSSVYSQTHLNFKISQHMRQFQLLNIFTDDSKENAAYTFSF